MTPIEVSEKNNLVALWKRLAEGKEKTEFLGGLTHEIRTLMHSVIGFADVLQKTSLDGKQKEYVDAILESAGILSSLINDLNDNGREEEKIVVRHDEGAESIKGISVLVVEDNPLNQKLMGILLRRMECTVEIANNGHEAILKAGGKDFDLILMDIQMPIMDGFEATEFLRTRMQINTPIIALTAKASKENDLKCITAGMNDFLTKPVEIGLLKEKINKWAKK